MPETAEKERIFRITRPDAGIIKELLSSGSIESCGKVLDEVLNGAGFFETSSPMLRTYICMDIFVTAKDFASETGISDETFADRFGTTDDIGRSLSSVTSAAGFLRETLEQCVSWRAGSARDNGASVVAKAKEYIDASYMNYDISLKTVADKVGLSPAYLSSQFKKEVGENLSDYLTHVRVKKAKELLCRTSKMVYEVAYDVGFHDYKYFSQIFKKCTGLTPRQYQNSANNCP